MNRFPKWWSDGVAALEKLVLDNRLLSEVAGDGEQARLQYIREGLDAYDGKRALSMRREAKEDARRLAEYAANIGAQAILGATTEVQEG